jgi:hypothetical protein
VFGLAGPAGGGRIEIRAGAASGRIAGLRTIVAAGLEVRSVDP